MRKLLYSFVRQFSKADPPPVTRKDIVILWNSMQPQDLLHTFAVRKKYGVNDLSGYRSSPTQGRGALLIQDLLRPLAFYIDLGELAGLDETDECLITVRHKFSPGGLVGMNHLSLVKQEDDSPARRMVVRHMEDCMPVTIENIRHIVPNADRFIEWCQATATIHEEVMNAVIVIDDVFRMAKTVGQVKRMVPDLIRYLPARNRAAFENQARSSSVPFEWAPYPKDNVNAMLTTLMKAHLLPGATNFERLHSDSIFEIDTKPWAKFAHGFTTDFSD